MENKFFLHQAKRTNGVIDKGIVVKDTYDAAKQGYDDAMSRMSWNWRPTWNHGGTW